MNWSIWRTRLGSGETVQLLTPEALRAALGGE